MENWLNFLVLIFIVVMLGRFIDKRMKVQDRQFRTLLSRLNELTGKEPDDHSSACEDKIEADEKSLKEFLRKK